MTTEPKTDRQTDRQTDCKKPNCPDPKAEDSVYCAKHRDMKYAANQRAAAKKNGAAPPVLKKTRRGRPPRVEAKVAAVDPIGEIDAAIAKRLAEIETLKAAKALIEL